ncbi:hypothetical protein NX059_000805 [Plenodomus lindquistii]|nr:hypothetical protein NX059_000805 [Plenodomus lindquistii]
MEPSMEVIGKDCLRKAETIATEDIGSPSIVKVQILVLVIKSHCRQRRMTEAFMLLAVAVRSAYALKLNHEAARLPFLAQESRRRLMWSLFLLDSTLSGGIREFSVCPIETIYVRLPCLERNFELDIVQETEPLRPAMDEIVTSNSGSLGLFVQLLWVRYNILKTTKEAVLSKGLGIDQLPAKIDSLAADLTKFEKTLPADLQFSKKNLQLRAYTPRLCRYVSIHIWLRQCYCDLYRVVLTGLKEALRDDQIRFLDPVIISDYRWKCFEHAKRLSQALGSAQILKKRSFVLEGDIHVCAYQCVRLLLQCFRLIRNTTDSPSEELLYDYINRCVSAVEAFSSTSPMCVEIEQDLRKLLHGGQSAHPSPRRGNSPINGTSNPTVSAPSHLFSRHNLLGQMDIRDDSADMALRADSDDEDMQGSQSLHTQTTVNAQSTPRIGLITSLPEPQWQFDNADLTSFEAFQRDLVGIWNADSINMEPYNWPDNHWAHTL